MEIGEQGRPSTRFTKSFRERHRAENDRITVVEDVGATLIEGGLLQFPLVAKRKKSIRPKHFTTQQMISRAGFLNANLGLLDAEFLVKNQQLIPVKLQACMLVFTGAKVTRGNEPDLFFPVLIYCYDRLKGHKCWSLIYRLVESDWSGPFRFVSRKETLSNQ